MIDQETLNEFDKLYKDTYDYTLKYVICHCSKIDDVNDIVQDVYVDVYKLLLKHTNIDNYKTYIMGIANNKIKDYYRFSYKEKIVSYFESKEEYDDIPDDIDIEKNYINKSNIDLIWDYLKNKSFLTFKIFYLFYNYGLNIKEIAKELNITESNVKHHLYRNLKEIKNLFGGKKND